MFRALKDILQEKPRDRYYSEGTGATTTTGQFRPVMESGQEEVTSQGVRIVDLERREAGPVVQEIIHPTEFIEIQPILRREREQIEVREITQPILEKTAFPVTVREEVRPEERKVMPPVPQDVIEEQLRKAKEGLVGSSKREAPVITVEEKPAIVEETVHKKIFEEIVPIVERHVKEPHIIKEKKPIYEKIIEPPTMVRRELPRIEREVPIRYAEPTFSYGSTPPAGAQMRKEDYKWQETGWQGSGWQGSGRQGSGWQGSGRQDYGYEGPGYYSGQPEYFKGQQSAGSFVDIPVQGGGHAAYSGLAPGQVRYA